MDTDSRLIEIETRLAFQEQTVSELSDLVHRQRKELDALLDVVRQVGADLQSLREGSRSGLVHEPPPHY